MKENGGRAFPADGLSSGMSLRDYFAAAALQPVTAMMIFALQNPEHIKGDLSITEELIAAQAYATADAMLKESIK